MLDHNIPLYLELGFNWFLVVIIMVIAIKSIKIVLPFIERVVVAKALWYLLVAFGYAMICVTLITSWAIWSFGHMAALVAILLTWFILIVVYFAHQRIEELSVEEGLFEVLAKKRSTKLSSLKK